MPAKMLDHYAADRWPRAASTITSAAASTATAPTATGPCRTSKRCCTTTRNWSRSTPKPTRARIWNCYRQVAEESVGFVLREMRDDEGAFHSALDAETDGIEGAHYVWTPKRSNSCSDPRKLHSSPPPTAGSRSGVRAWPDSASPAVVRGDGSASCSFPKRSPVATAVRQPAGIARGAATAAGIAQGRQGDCRLERADDLRACESRFHSQWNPNTPRRLKEAALFILARMRDDEAGCCTLLSGTCLPVRLSGRLRHCLCSRCSICIRPRETNNG